VYVRDAWPLVFADPDFVDRSRLSDVTERLLERGLPRDEEWVEIHPELAQRLHLRRRVVPAHALRTRLRRLLEDAGWFYESSGATTVALLMAGLASSPPLSPEAAAADRWIQAKVFEESEYGARELRSSFSPAARHLVRVWVGPERDDSIRADRPLPEDDLPWEGGESQPLVVVFSEPRFKPEPQAKTIDLPAAGESTSCELDLDLSGAVPGDSVEARIIVLHRNRVLQTALLTGKVAISGDASSAIRLSVEVPVRPGMRDLDAREEFGSAVVVSPASSGESTITVVRGEESRLVNIANLQHHLTTLSEQLTRHVRRSPTTASAAAAGGAQAELPPIYRALRLFAILGGVLRRRIVEDNGLGEFLQTEGPIQIVATKPDAFLPLEFLYDGDSPDENAQPCPRASEALELGRCPQGCPKPVDPHSMFCPLRLWCLNRVIERHAHQPQLVPQAAEGVFALRVDPNPNRRQLPLFGGAVLAASERVHKSAGNGLEQLLDALQGATGGQAQLVLSWKEWRQAVVDTSPTLLVLLAHTGTDTSTGLPTLEIGSEPLLISSIRPDHVRPKPETSPVVLLLGCETGATDAQYSMCVAQFRDRHAAIILTTYSVVLGPHAVMAASELVNALRELAQDDEAQPFGEALLRARRALVGRGVVMALGLVAYCDADWLVTRA
jgi:hypothetical protein